ncbi:hypothetical protein B0H19DRAFT_1193013 [Mycena capillaripes]|nr:hypothetical protein B0H19DRAFT_1193013 [Mycena capillaripes]
MELAQPTSLVFEKNSMMDTTITRNGSPIYKVSTDKHGSTTEVHAPGTDTVLARIVRRELFPDTVLFPEDDNGKSTRVSKWLKRTTLADNSTAVTLETVWGSSVLGTHPDYGLALYGPDRSNIIARWRLQTQSSPLALIIASGLERFQAQILTAFLYEEQRLRITDKNRRLDFETTVYRGSRPSGSSVMTSTSQPQDYIQGR